ncbi:hypothetical protein NDU88_001539 [Pleurodeles waltl]|uniref:Uncharacterized protein n=1 Tax=Pleurodeles waltl TaxID=8319 RepID=A0AAV7UX23_PLEWA|nr:hypothetical protein NDU88_001539 [Pleurodeles waltl]
MGKRKAVDLPAPPKGTKKAKKLSRKQVNQIPLSGQNDLDAIDLLFEEVESILGKYFPPALSTVINMVPNILCTNRFELLQENNDMPF